MSNCWLLAMRDVWQHNCIIFYLFFRAILILIDCGYWIQFISKRIEYTTEENVMNLKYIKKLKIWMKTKGTSILFLLKWLFSVKERTNYSTSSDLARNKTVNRQILFVESTFGVNIRYNWGKLTISQALILKTMNYIAPTSFHASVRFRSIRSNGNFKSTLLVACTSKQHVR